MKNKSDYIQKYVPLEYKKAFEIMLKSTNDSVFFKDKESRFFCISNAQLQRLGKKRLEEVLGKTDFDFFLKEDAQRYFDFEKKIMKTGKPNINTEELTTWANGEKSWYKVSRYPLYDRDNNIIGTWGISTDITQQKEVEFQLAELNRELEEARMFYQNQSETDEMTDLYNQRKFFEEATAAYARSLKYKRKEDNFCVAFLDVDCFKSANDSFGHDYGNFVLKEISSIIKKMIRKYDIAFRYGGDEFLVLYKGIANDEAIFITERIRAGVACRIFSNNDNDFKTTISAGVACCTEAADVDELIKLADSRLYNAKSSGKNKIV